MFTDNVKKYIARRRMAMYALCDNIAQQMEKTAKSVAPWKDRTSHARQSINSDTTRKGDEIEMTVSHGVKYGRYLEKGTSPHEIRLKNKKAFMWNGLPHPIKKNPIHHPGTKPYPAITPAAEKGKELLKKYVDELWR